jgi:hypothetical protein
MKTVILSIFCLIVLFSANKSIAQNYTLIINQPQILQADAGNDIVLSLGNSIHIGAAQPALFGYGDYHYEWSPTQWLDDPYAANPVATPLDTITYTLRVFDFNECVAEDLMTIFVTAASVDSYKVNDYFAIYPNPSHGEFYIHSENEICIGQINIYDLSGKLIYTEESSNGENIYRNINLNGQPAGQYFIQIIADSKIFNGKITIN